MCSRYIIVSLENCTITWSWISKLWQWHGHGFHGRPLLPPSPAALLGENKLTFILGVFRNAEKIMSWIQIHQLLLACVNQRKFFALLILVRIFFFSCLCGLMVECSVSYLKDPDSNPAWNLYILAIFLCLSRSLPTPSISLYSKSLRDKITHFSDWFFSI